MKSRLMFCTVDGDHTHNPRSARVVRTMMESVLPDGVQCRVFTTTEQAVEGFQGTVVVLVDGYCPGDREYTPVRSRGKWGQSWTHGAHGLVVVNHNCNENRCAQQVVAVVSKRGVDGWGPMPDQARRRARRLKDERRRYPSGSPHRHRSIHATI